MIAILGAGESGLGAALLAKSRGIRVFVSDSGPIAEPFKDILQAHDIPFEEKGHNIEKIVQADELIKSPGIPPGAEILRQVRAAHIPVISEIEFAYRYCEGKIIAITGSNGKTTTTNLIHHLLVYAGRDAVKCGNVGTSFAKAVKERKAGYYVIELSSFQLEDIRDFKPDTAIITNVTPDHLDRYEYDIRQYAEAKFHIGINQSEEDLLITGFLDDELKMRLYEMVPQPEKIETGKGKANTVFVNGRVLFTFENQDLTGRHNAQNVSCSVAALLREGLTQEMLKTGIECFVNDPHRMELVATKAGVHYINDSKATNVDAVFYALDAMTGPVVWIAGGVDKGNVYDQLYPALKSQVKALICLGTDNKKLKEAFEGKIPVIKEASSMEEAIRKARALAKNGDTVLLSPACASFDLFDNYMHRGELFKQQVNKIKD